MIRKALLAALVIVGLFAAPASAQYSNFVVNPGSVSAGGTSTFSGSGCQPGEEVVIAFDGQTVATVNANDNGEYSGTFVVPASTRPGTYTVTATCGAVVNSDTLTVLGTGATPPGGNGTTTLPRTGSNLNTMGIVGAALLAIGGFFLLANRKRHA